MPHTGLITSDAGTNMIAFVLGNLLYKLGIGNQCPRHANHVGLTLGQDF